MLYLYGDPMTDDPIIKAALEAGLVGECRTKGCLHIYAKAKTSATLLELLPSFAAIIAAPLNARIAELEEGLVKGDHA